MRYKISIALFIFITTCSFSHDKWIPLMKENSKESNKSMQSRPFDINLSQMQTPNRIIQGAKVIQYFLQNKDNKKKLIKPEEKKWFKID